MKYILNIYFTAVSVLQFFLHLLYIYMYIYIWLYTYIHIYPYIHTQRDGWHDCTSRGNAEKMLSWFTELQELCEEIEG